MNEEYYLKTVEELEREFSTDANSGLSSKSASLRAYRGNRGTRLYFGYVLGSLFSLVCVLLLLYLNTVSGVFSLVVWALANGALAFLKKSADKSMRAIFSQVVSDSATVIRDGVEREVSPENLVDGDLVVYSAGDVVCCRSYIVSSDNLTVLKDYGSAKRIESASDDADEESANKKTRKILSSGDIIVSGTCRVFVLESVFDKFELDRDRFVNGGADFVCHGKYRPYVSAIGYLRILFAVLLIIFGFVAYRDNAYMLVSCLLWASLVLSFLSPDFFAVVFHIYWAKVSEYSLYGGYVIKDPSAMEDLESVNTVILPDRSILSSTQRVVSRAVTCSGVYPLNRYHSYDDIAGDARYFLRCACCLDRCFDGGMYESSGCETLSEEILSATSDYLTSIKASSGNFEVVDYYKLDSVFNSGMFDCALIKSSERTFYAIRGEASNVISACNAYLNNGRICLMDKSYKNQLLSDMAAYRALGCEIIAYARSEYRSSDVRRSTDFNGRLQFVGYLVFASAVSPLAADMIRSLKENGIRPVVLLNGQKKEALCIIEANRMFEGCSACDHVDSNEGIYDVYLGLTPQQRKTLVSICEKENRKALYIADSFEDYSACTVAYKSAFVDKKIRQTRISRWWIPFSQLFFKAKKSSCAKKCDAGKQCCYMLVYGNAKSVGNLLNPKESPTSKLKSVLLFVISVMLSLLLFVVSSALFETGVLIGARSAVALFCLVLLSVLLMVGTDASKHIRSVSPRAPFAVLWKMAVIALVPAIVFNLLCVFLPSFDVRSFSFAFFFVIVLSNLICRIRFSGISVIYCALCLGLLALLPFSETLCRFFEISRPGYASLALSIGCGAMHSLLQYMFAFKIDIKRKMREKGNLPHNNS